jgi:hypothetical protein
VVGLEGNFLGGKTRLPLYFPLTTRITIALLK